MGALDHENPAIAPSTAPSTAPGFQSRFFKQHQQLARENVESAVHEIERLAAGEEG